MSKIKGERMEIEYKISERSGKILHCPKCGDTLVETWHRNVNVDYCVKCNGVWVDHIEERSLLDMTPQGFTIDELKQLRKIYEAVSTVDDSGYVPCPICEQLMQRRNWGGYSGVIVDRCLTHGTWYDAGELEKIQNYIDLGGIEYEKYKRDDLEITGLHQELSLRALKLSKEIKDSYTRARLYSLTGF